MGLDLFELLFERRNPGSIGKIERREKTVEPVSIGVLMVKSLISLVILIGVYVLFLGLTFRLVRFLSYVGIMLVYCILGYCIDPKPDYDNIGWLGGLIDNPFRYSDDINRMLIFLMLLLYPGRLISTTLVAWTAFFRNQKAGY